MYTRGDAKSKNNKKDKRDITTAGSANTPAGFHHAEMEREAAADLARSKRYHRADEEFAYHTDDGESSEWAISKSKVKKPKKAYYFPARAPEVNEFHPPSTSTVPARNSERAWMKMAPPSADFMGGKKSVTRVGRSGTGGSSIAPALDSKLAKQMGLEVVGSQAKRKQAQMEGGHQLKLRIKNAFPSRTNSQSSTGKGISPIEKGRSTPRKARKRPEALRLNSSSWSDDDDNERPVNDIPQRDGALSALKRDSLNGRVSVPPNATQPKIRPPIFTGRSEESAMTRSRSTTNNENSRPQSSTPRSPTSPSRSPPSRSPLSPRSSISNGSVPRSLSPRTRTPLQRANTSTENYTPSPRKRNDTKIDAEIGRPRLYIKDSSLNVLQNMVEPSSLLNSRFIRSPTIEAKIPLPMGSGDSVTDMWIGVPGDEDWIPPPKRWSTGALDTEN